MCLVKLEFLHLFVQTRVHTCVWSNQSSYMCLVKLEFLHMFGQTRVPKCVWSNQSSYMCLAKLEFLHVFGQSRVPKCVWPNQSSYMVLAIYKQSKLVSFTIEQKHTRTINIAYMIRWSINKPVPPSLFLNQMSHFFLVK